MSTPAHLNPATHTPAQDLATEVFNDPVKYDEEAAPTSESTTDLVVSAYVGLTTAQAIRKFWRLYLWGLGVTFAGM
jgi:hypothetical protein